MGKIAAFFGGVLVVDGVAILLMGGGGVGMALLVPGVALSALALGRLTPQPGEAWPAWAMGVLAAQVFCALYAVNAILSVVGMGSKNMWDDQERKANKRKDEAKRAAATAGKSHNVAGAYTGQKTATRSYDAAGAYSGQTFDGTSYDASGDYVGRVVDGKFYNASGDYNGQIIEGKHYDASGDFSGQVVDGKRYDASGKYIGQVIES